ncbi:interleukin-7 receptor subunit alpha [Symphorus nematophorus]
MSCGCWITVQLLLLLPAVTEAQSGDGDADMEPRISCLSHIMTGGSSLTCKLLGGRNGEDDDEDDDDGIQSMTVCYTDWSTKTVNCVESLGDTVSSKQLNPVNHYNVTVHFKRGGHVSTIIDLKKIVKPRPPQVWNITFDRDSNQAVIYIQTPYHKEYLKVENQLFQLLIWTADRSTIQNTSTLEMKMNMDRLQKDAEYHVKVRAIPQNFLQGTWSSWSETFSFFTPPGEKEKVQKHADEQRDINTLTVCLVLLVVVSSSAVFFWKNKIFSYMWPSIPHPKHTLMHICKPNKGLLLNFHPEVFSALRVDPMERAEEPPCEEAEPSSAEDARSADPCSAHSSDCCRSATSVSTEELELSALLSRSSSDGEDSLQSASPSPVHALQPAERPHTPEPEGGGGGGGNKAEAFAVSQQDEAYVTMSSFYQIK